MTKIQKFRTLVFLSILFFLCSATSVFAAEIFFDAGIEELTANQEFQADIVLNTEGEVINAVEGSILFPEDSLWLVEAIDGNSIINFWIERPALKSHGKVVFSGIVPGGYVGDRAHLFSLVFKTRKEGYGAIEFQGVRVLKNDGIGTSAETKISNVQFFASGQSPRSQLSDPKMKDTERPESFVPEIAKNPALFDERWFVVFATQDKASGIDRYEVKESRQMMVSVFVKWIPAESPHVLADQELRSFVWIKAVDKAGNERIIKIEPKHPLAWYENYEKWIIIIVIVGLLIIAFVARKLWKKQLA